MTTMQVWRRLLLMIACHTTHAEMQSSLSLDAPGDISHVWHLRLQNVSHAGVAHLKPGSLGRRSSSARGAIR